MLIVRPAQHNDHESIWAILEPVIRAGETYTLPRDMSRESGLAYWFAEPHEVHVAEDDGVILGTYFLQPNQRGGGSHVSNCGYVTASQVTGRGVASAMCEHSLARARELGFLAMQFNFVVSSNERAVRLWQRHGFQIVGCLPKAFRHPALGLIDAYVMYRELI